MPEPRETPPHPAEEDVPARAANETGRGREAEHPGQLQRGWKDVLWRTKQQLGADNISIIGAGCAFYAFLAVVPALAVTIAVYALFADPNQLTHQLDALARVVPSEVMPLLEQQMRRITANTTAASVSAVIGLLVALYGSARATKALISGMNIAYDEQEKRGFLKLNAVALALTLAGIVGVLLAVGFLTVLPPVLERVIGPNNSITWLRWPLLAGLFMTGVAVLYRWAPSRDEARWRWISPGAVLAAVLWVAGSALFSLYVSRFSSYEKTYGSLGAVVIFLMWLYLTAFVVLLGAELNSEMERQTKRDTTKGSPKPLGERGAYAADTLGRAAEEKE